MQATQQLENTTRLRHVSIQSTDHARQLIAFALGVTLITNTFSSGPERYKYLGTVSLVITLAGPAFLHLLSLLNKQSRPRFSSRWVWAMGVLSVLYAPRIALSEMDLSAITPVLQILLVSGFYIAISSTRWTRSRLIILSLAPALWCLAMAAAACAGDPPYSGYLDNPNVFGSLAAVLSAVVLTACASLRNGLRQPAMFFVASLGAICVSQSVGRSAMVAFLVGGITWLAWNRIAQHRWLHRGLFITVVAGSLALIIGQTLIVDWLTESGYLDLSRSLTDKNLGTRAVIWNEIIDVISYQPLFGSGGATSVGDLLNADRSAHCLYLQVALQSGLVGLSALLIALWITWENTWSGRHDAVVRVAASAMTGALVHQTFEVALTQNHLSFGCQVWLAMGIATSRSREAAATMANVACKQAGIGRRKSFSRRSCRAREVPQRSNASIGVKAVRTLNQP